MTDYKIQKFDFPFSSRDSYMVLPWVMGFMVFLAVLALSVAINLHVMASGWKEDHSHTITLQLPVLGKHLDEDKKRLESDLPALEGVQKVEWIQQQAIILLLAPWLGEDISSKDLPLPVLADVTLDNSEMDAQGLRRWLDRQGIDATVDEHREWLSDFINMALWAERLASAMVIMVVVVTTLVILISTRTEMALHRDTLEVLRGLGAEAKYIANQFQWRSLLLCLRGASAGAIAGIIVLVAFWQLSSHAAAPFIPLMHVGFSHIAAVLTFLLLCLALSLLVARRTAISYLKALD